MNDKEAGRLLESDVLLTMDGIVNDGDTLHVLAAYQLWCIPEMDTAEAYDLLANHFAKLAEEVRADQG